MAAVYSAFAVSNDGWTVVRSPAQPPAAPRLPCGPESPPPQPEIDMHTTIPTFLQRFESSSSRVGIWLQWRRRHHQLLTTFRKVRYPGAITAKL
ncbi:hypothetical protein I553_9286 [Mycobacterium xenopi 4042]|uniref:Uncharacterized protein n=1 Tax=Mycobacterium xenopi 4042 TaxID=1299334 RepID=X7ZLC5_MYCXE|nr:hypothetical protein I553_9286 [Mycobacterium xenopi 4042]